MSQFEPLAQIATQFIKDQDLARAAADEVAEGEVICGQVNDPINKEIVIGHVLVAVFYGDQQTIERIGQLIRATADNVSEIESDGV